VIRITIQIIQSFRAFARAERLFATLWSPNGPGPSSYK
jgi:hypothetical protein